MSPTNSPPIKGSDIVDRPSFNLVDGPWIRVQLPNEKSELVSLREIFERLSEVSSLNGESPTQDTALLRLIMAILIRSIRHAQVIDPSWSTAEAWSMLYRSDDLAGIVVDYLSEHRDRFDLFDRTAPFYQVADLRKVKEKYSDASVLIPDIGPAMFSTRTQKDAEVLDPAGAARWLVRLQAYDFSGIKSGAVGDSRVTQGKGAPTGTGWAGAIGSIMLAGPTLRDTLLLNLPISELFVSGREADGDLPPWEREPDQSAPRSIGEVIPHGVVDLLTWQQRRVRFFPQAGTSDVANVMIANGDKLDRKSRYEEPYSAQRFSEIQTKKAGKEVRFARTLDPDLTVWRGVQAIFADAGLPDTAGSETRKKAVPDQPAPVLTQLNHDIGDVVEDAFGDTPLGLGLTGVKYGTQDAVVESEMYEFLPVSISLLMAEGLHLRRAALVAVDRVMTLRGKYRWFLRQLQVSAGASTDEYPEAQVLPWLDELQVAFTQWLGDLRRGTDEPTADLRWRKALYRITERAIDRAIEQAGPRAAVGRIRETKDSTEFHSAGRHRAWMMKELRDVTGALPRAPRTDSAPHDDLTTPSATTDSKESTNE